MEFSAINYIYGLCTMFYGITAGMFLYKGDKLSKLASLLMGTICIQCIKDLIFIDLGFYDDPYYWPIMTSIDIVAVPMYAFILMELVRPGMLNFKQMIIHELPFILLPVIYIATRIDIFYYALVITSAAYGTFFLLWTTFNIPIYNRQLKERFSYTENINLNWLRVILYSFYLILALWILDSLVIHLNLECMYMSGSLAIWIIIDVFIYKHESILDELDGEQETNTNTSLQPNVAPTSITPDLGKRIETLFHKQQIYLNPHLKVSDVAKAVGTNRTYVSNHFNHEIGTTFYDYVNGFRIEHSCQLLETTNESIKCIAERSGFSSPQAFIRVFTRLKGISPTAFRKEQQTA